MKNKSIVLKSFNDGIRNFGQLYGCRVETVPTMKMVGAIMQKSQPTAALLMFPEDQLKSVEKTINSGGTLHDYFVNSLGVKAAENQPDFTISTNFITQSTFESLENNDGWQIAQRYQGERVEENLRLLLSEDGEQLYRNTSLHVVGDNPFSDILYRGEQIMKEPVVTNNRKTTTKTK